ncbi:MULTISPECIES: GNAT family N-acetyltransferase [unclassified Streptomyces]|uniref:GNAT family N-acetyltransferase n=1 Tax=unclassified Streptomyces TaxID=2593676 RepID=UPI002F9134BF
MEEREDACPHIVLEELEIPQGSTGMPRQSFGPTAPVTVPQTSDPLRRAPEMFPESILHTNRLILRPFDASDIPDTHASCADALTQRWLPLPKPYTLDDATNWCTTTAHALRDSGDGIQFAVTDAYTKRLMGQVGLKKTDWRALVSEVGYWVSPWARGHGIAAEATRALALWLLAEQQFQRLELRAATENTASQKVALKAGFHPEGTLRNAGFVHGGRVDLVLFSMVPGDLAPPARHYRS